MHAMRCATPNCSFSLFASGFNSFDVFPFLRYIYINNNEIYSTHAELIIQNDVKIDEVKWNQNKCWFDVILLNSHANIFFPYAYNCIHAWNKKWYEKREKLKLRGLFFTLKQNSIHWKLFFFVVKPKNLPQPFNFVP